MSLQYQLKVEDLISQERTSKESIKTIQKWLIDTGEQKYVPKNLPIELIALFLLSCNNDVDAAKKVIISHFKLKHACPDIHDNRNVYTKQSESTMNAWTIVTLPKRTKENYVIHYFKLVDNDYRKCNVAEIFKASLMLLDVSLDKKNPPDGLIVITDMGEARLMHLTRIKLDLCIKYFNFLQDGLPIKLQAVHYMRSNLALTKSFSMFKTLIKNNVFDKMHFHPSNLSMEKFYEFIPKECLPEDFGGDLPWLKDLHEKTKQQFKDKQEFWNMEEQLRKKCYQC